MPESAPLNPAFKKYLSSKKSSQVKPPKHGLGLVPSPVDFASLTGTAVTVRRTKGSFPASYDLRTTGKLTPVKDQGVYGACWAHAACASLESRLMPGSTNDYSENNMVNLHGFDLGFDSGGQALMAMAYLTRWAGPVNESDDPYPHPGASPAGATVRKHVQQVTRFQAKTGPLDNDPIKQAILDYGAVYVSYYHQAAYYNSTYKSYCFAGTSNVNHGVAIVGWDDNFDRNKFVSPPASNGAYIVRNSWGSSWGESGYFYVSYYDSKMGYTELYSFHNADATNNYTMFYSYDPLGWVNNIGAGSSTFWAANIYTASNSDSLLAVGFYTVTVNTDYEIYVYTGVSAGAPRSGTLAATATGSYPYSGYHTVTLPTPPLLTAGSRFSIVLKNTTSGYTMPQAYEYAQAGYSSGATSAPGQSYYSGAGSSWTDLTTYRASANFCIKGYSGPTLDLTPPFFSAITASPSTARLGLGVTLSFTASETLTNNPTVTVNSRSASYVGSAGTNYTYAYTVQSADTNGPATLVISGVDPAGNAGSTTNTAALYIDRVTPVYADLAVTKSVDRSGAIPGDSATYTLAVSNAGPDIATAVQVSDALPAGAAYASHAGGSYVPGSGLWDIGMLAPNASTSLTIQAVAQGVPVGTVVTNRATVLSLNETDPIATNDSASAAFTVLAIPAAYVATNGSHAYPYTNWATAASNIQAAVNAVRPGGVVWVSNGVYASGGVAVYGISNRVALTQAVTVCSVNGPAYTFIVGQGPNGGAAMRCAYVTNGAVLAGFTLTNGHTFIFGDVYQQRSGGAVNMDYGGTVSNCVLVNSGANDNGGGAFFKNGGLLVDSTLRGNTASWGGGVWLGAGGTVSNCVVVGNASSYAGGGVFFYHGGTVLNGRLTGNQSQNGGGFYFLDVGGTGLNSLLSSNTATANGGGVCFADNGAIVNCTISSNTAASNGGGVYGNGTVVNSIIYSNTAPSGFNWSSSAASYTNCCSVPLPSPGTGNTTNNPRFVNFGAGNFRLQTNSPCTNAGVNQAWMAGATDLDGRARIFAGAVDIGAYESILFRITASAGFGGSISPAGTNWYSAGDSPVFTTTPEAHQHVADVTVDGVSAGATNAYTFGPLTGNHEIAASFAIDRISLAVFSERGAPDPAAGLMTNDWGTGVTCSVLEPEPAGSTQYTCKGWVLAGQTDQSGNTSGSGTHVTLIHTNDAVLTWRWGTNVLFSSSVLSGSGTITGSTNGWYAIGGSVTVTAAPAADWYFAGWSGDVPAGQEAGKPLTLAMDRPRSVQAAFMASPYTNYVSTNGLNQYPFETWEKAATTLQAAVDAVHSNGTVWASNGVYAAGGAVVWGASNRVALTRGVTLQSVNGPAVTFIAGAAHPGTTNGATAMRCVYMTNGTTLAGFTLTNGHTQVSGDSYKVRSGGGLFMDRGGVASNCVVSGNTAHYNAGGAVLYYGGIFKNSVVMGNASASSGGGALLYNGGTIQYAQVKGNASISGGGIFLSGSGCMLQYSGINSNTASTGGGVYFSSGGTMQNCSLKGNVATTYGGGVYAGSGGLVQNCTIVGNSASSYAGGFYGSSGGTVVNTIIYSNTASIQVNWTNTGSGTSYSNCCTIPAAGSGCVTNGPALANITGGDFHLLADSPCLDAGINQAWMADAVDLAGQARIMNGTVDIGAYEGGWHAIIVSAGPGGSVTPSGTVCVTPGESQSFAIAANADCHVLGVAVDGIPIGVTNAYVFANVQSSHTLSVSFAPDWPRLTVMAEHGIPTPGNGLHTNGWGTSVTCDLAGAVEMSSSTQFVCKGWALAGQTEAGGAVSGSGTNLILIHTNDAVLTWLWQTNVYLDFGVLSGQGTLSATSGWYDAYATLSITGRPAAGSSFAGWSGDVPAGQERVNPLVLKPGQPLSIRGSFMTSPATCYVATTGLDQYPFDTWENAATTIQGAVEFVAANGTVWVSNGVYASGGAVVWGASNRVALTRGVSLRSVNGPQATFIVGATHPGTVNGATAMRCVYMTNGTFLAGFTLTNGHTQVTGDSRARQGGGILLERGGLASNCVMSGNSAYQGGGGASTYYGGRLQDCVVSGNSAQFGGGFYLSSGGTVEGCRISGNVASIQGGAALASGGAIIRNTLITGNTSSSSVGGVEIESGSILQNCTIIGNSASTSVGGIQCWYSGTVVNTIIYSNTASSSPNVNNVGGGASFDNCCTFPSIGNACVTNAPLFVNAGAGDYRLPAGAPCVNAGVNQAWMAGAPDLDGQARIFDGTADIGAFESTWCRITASAGAGGTLSPTGTFWFAAGDTPSFAISPAAHQHVADLTVDGVSVSTTTNYTFEPLAGSHALVVSFAIDRFSLTVAPDHGSPVPAAGVLTNDWGTSVTCGVQALEQAGGTQYVGLGWALAGQANQSGNTSGSGTNLTLVHTNDAVLTWLWRTNVLFSRQILSGSGTLSGSTNGWYVIGSSVSVTAAPAANGYVEWSGDVPADQEHVNPLVLTMDQPRSIQASFLAMPATTYVATDGLNQYPFETWEKAATTIQAGVDYVSAGGTVWVSNGVYASGGASVYGASNRVALTRAVSVRSVNGPDATFIVGQGPIGSGAMRCAYVTNGAVLAGFTLTNGFTMWGDADKIEAGGGAWLDRGGLVSNCVMVGNGSAYRGGGVFCYYGGTVSHCVMSGNQAYDGGGSYCFYTGTVVNCLMTGNSATYGGGSYCWFGGTVKNCTLSGNSAATSGGGTYCFMGGAFINLIVYSNSSPSTNWGGVGSDWAFTNCCSIPLPSPGNGNITNNPRFANMAAGNFRLQAGSPCINAGANQAWMAGATDLDGKPRAVGQVDIGAYENGFVITASAGFGGSISPSGTVWVSGGTTQAFAIAANPRRVVTDVLGDGVSVGATNAYTFANVVSNHTLSASFSNERYALSVISTHGAPVPESGTMTNDWGTSVTCGVQALEQGGSTQYVCLGWALAGQADQSGATSGSGTNLTLVLTNDAVLTWLWRTNVLFSRQILSGSGTLSGSTNGWYAIGASVSVTAAPAADRYVEWIGDVPAGQEQANPLTLTMNQSRSIQATFLALPATTFVATNGLNQYPFETWSKAATTIQAAVNAVCVSGTVWVSNGVYAAGGAVVNGVSNRVSLTRGVALRSVNGPDVTFIAGGGVNGPAAVRGVYMTNGTVLAGFTVTNGHTLATGSGLAQTAGGGVWMDRGGLVSNCVITANASIYGGGVFLNSGGLVQNCRVSGNTALSCGGAFLSASGEIRNSMVTSNSALYGAGVRFVSGGILRNVAICGNTAQVYGGGIEFISGGTLINCTVSGNSAGKGGGVYSDSNGTLVNTVIYSNSAPTAPNWFNENVAASYSSCCTFPSTGTGCVTNTPLFVNAAAGNYRLQAGSPCIDAGVNQAWMAGAVDLDGHDRIQNGVVDIGAYEFDWFVLAVSSSGNGTLSGSTGGLYAAGASVCVTAAPAADWYFGSWTGDVPAGLEQANPLTLTMDQNRSVQAVFLALPATTFVATNGLNQYPFETWSKAATTIQAAVNAVLTNGTVWVSNGVYASGGAAVYGSSNRVALTQAVTVCSVNGPEYTFINGKGPIGNGAIRCAYLTNGAVLTGFTMTNGYTMATGDQYTNRAGGGVWLDHGGIVSNCVIAGNRSDQGGGGACCYFGGILSDCSVNNNISGNNGGGVSCAQGGVLVNCRIKANTASMAGGGVNCWYGGTLRSCLLSGNSSYIGAGIYCMNGGSVQNCTIILNTASSSVGGGFFAGNQVNSIIYSNSAPSSPNWSMSGSAIFTNCCSVPLPSRGSGNFTSDPQFVDYSTARLKPTSPCINAGVNQAWMAGALDLGGQARIFDGTVDIGAYESTACRIIASAGPGGAISPAGTNWYAVGDTPVFTVTPAAHQYIADVTVDGVSVGATNVYAFGPLTGSHAIAASFSVDRYAFTVVSGQEGATPAAGAYTNDFGTVLDCTAPGVLSVAGGTQFVCTGWALAGQTDQSGNTSGSGTNLTLVQTNDATLTWSWRTNVLFSRQILSGSGTLSGSTGGWYVIGSSVCVTATPAVDFYLAWSGDVPAGQEQVSTLTLTLDQARSVQAAFLAIPATTYVATNGLNRYPFETWEKAATTIQMAVDAVHSNGTVWVSNGVYAAGGRDVYGSNRVALTRGVTLQSVNGPQATFIVGEAHPATTNGATAMRCVYVTTGTVLAGFTLTNGHTQVIGDSFRIQAGGGVLLDRGGFVSNCVMVGNSAQYSGGGASLYAGGLLQKTDFARNFSQYGGGVSIIFAGTVQYCVMSNNDVSTMGGGAYMNAGGLIEECTLIGNRSPLGGGGVDVNSSGTIRRCRIVGNVTAFRGGGVFLNSNSSILQNCMVVSNTAISGGGASAYGGGLLQNCLFAGNTAHHGGGVECITAGLMQNCTVVGNSASSYGGGLFCNAEGSVVNTIVHDNAAPRSPNWTNALSGMVYSNCCAFPSIGLGCGTNDPLFVNAAAGDFRLQGSSPCINAGMNQAWMTGANDVGANPRILNGIVDIGAFEGAWYSITASAGEGGSITPSGTLWFAPGATQSYAIAAGPNRHVAEVLADGVSVGATSVHVFSDIASNHTLSAFFAIDRYPLTVVSGHGLPVPATGTVSNDWGASVTCGMDGAVEQAGPTQYVCTGWVLSGQPDAEGAFSGGTTNVTLIHTNDAVLTWQWRTNVFFSRQILSGSGTLSGSSNGWYAIGASVSVTAAPAADCYVEWSGGVPAGQEHANPLALTLDEACSIQATFLAMPATTYVATNGLNQYPFETWSKAATTIQVAVDSVLSNGTVWVSNGVYAAGGAVVNGVSNRVSLTRGVALRSMNGPDVTFIVGGGVNGPAAVRGVCMTNGTVLTGFTVTNGHTLATGDWTSQRAGGGIWMDRGGLVSNCVMTGNSADYGGGLFLYLGGLVQNCRVSGNTAPCSGGILLYVGGEMRNSVVTSNSALYGAGGDLVSGGILRNVAVCGNTAQVFGGGIELVSGGTLINCTVSGNSASTGGGVYSYINGTLVNTVIYSNSAPSSPNWFNESVAASYANCCTFPSIGTGCVTNDPLFVNAAAGDYRLQPESPCINAGTNQAWMAGATDLDGQPRISGGAVDIGAYEIGGNVITASAGPHGSLSPSGAVWVALGASRTFLVEPDAFYGIGDVRVDGSPVGPTNRVAFQNVVTNHAIASTYMALLAVSNTPQWWLAQHGLAPDGTGEAFDDGDGFPAWQEYIANTDPTNPASFFHVVAVSNLPPWTVYFEAGSNREYTLERCTDLAAGQWLTAGDSNRWSGGGPFSLSDPASAPSSGFWRLKVRLHPEP